MSPCITIAERLPTVKTHAQTHRAARRTHSPSFWSLVHAEIDGHLTFVRKDWESMWMNLRNSWDLASLQKNRCATYTVSHLADVFARRSLWGVVGPILLGRRKTRHVDIRQIGCCDGLRACLSQCLGSSSLLDRAKKAAMGQRIGTNSVCKKRRTIQSYSSSLILAYSFCNWLPDTTGLNQDSIRFLHSSHNDEQSCQAQIHCWNSGHFEGEQPAIKLQ